MMYVLLNREKEGVRGEREKERKREGERKHERRLKKRRRSLLVYICVELN